MDDVETTSERLLAEHVLAAGAREVLVGGLGIGFTTQALLDVYTLKNRLGELDGASIWIIGDVDSGLVRMVRRDPPAATASREQVFAVIDAAFAQRRKTLRAALAGWAGSPAEAEAYLAAAGVDHRARGEVLTVEDFTRIADAAAGQRP